MLSLLVPLANRFILYNWESKKEVGKVAVECYWFAMGLFENYELSHIYMLVRTCKVFAGLTKHENSSFDLKAFQSSGVFLDYI